MVSDNPDLTDPDFVFRFDEENATWQAAGERGWGENDPSLAEYTHGGSMGAHEVTMQQAAEVADRVFHGGS